MPPIDKDDYDDVPVFDQLVELISKMTDAEQEKLLEVLKQRGAEEKQREQRISLYTETTFLGLIPIPTSVSHDDIEKLYRSMYKFFHPAMKATLRFQTLRAAPVVRALFISLNFYADKPQTSISDFTVISLNSWGEVYLRSYEGTAALPSMDATKSNILSMLGLKKFPEKTAFYFARGVARG